MARDRSARARDISRQIASLSAELDRILRVDSSSPSPPRSSSPAPSASGPIQVEEIVFVTNRYGGHFGKRAKVIGLAGRESLHLRLLSTGETLQKRRRNVSRLR